MEELQVELQKEPEKVKTKSRFYALVVVKELDGDRVQIFEGDTRKSLEAQLADFEKQDVLWAFRGKIKPLTAKSNISF